MFADKREPVMFSGWPLPVRMKPPKPRAASPSNTVVCSRHPPSNGAETEPFCEPLGPLSKTITNRSVSLNGNGRRRMALTTLKIAVFAPMPSASVSTATAVKPGLFSSWRKANLRSFITQRLHWIDLCRVAGGQPAGGERYRQQKQRYRRKRRWINRLDLEQQA